MPKITYVDHAGTERTVEGSVGATVMETALRNNVPGIDAECGGACACATCHVYVADAWIEVVGKAAGHGAGHARFRQRRAREFPPVLPDQDHAERSTARGDDALRRADRQR